MAESLRDRLARSLDGEVHSDVTLARHTTWRVGGTADLFVVPADVADLRRAVALLNEAAIPWLPLGAGSNLLVRDGGIRGAVLSLRRLRRLEAVGEHCLAAEAGVPLMTLIQEAIARGLGGLEDLAGIPGTVGGGIAMNAGAGEQTVGGVTETLQMLTSGGVPEEWPAARARFAYRHAELAGGVVLGGLFRFRPQAPELLEERFRAWLERRRTTQGVEGANAGSVFRNPPGHRAWQLIDAAGLRGAGEGRAQVSRQHANFIVNLGGATAAEIERLMERVRTAVHAHSGIWLEPEVRVVGEAA